jgi:L-lactate dehydrogenase (cytochrome)
MAPLSSIASLPAIVAEIGNRMEVHMDGGIRSGQDVLKAVALGAKGVPTSAARSCMAWARMGEEGVTKALQIIHKEMDITMALCGKTRIEHIDKSILLPGSYPT